MLVDYPKLLQDPTWKKVEKAAGVSSTGVGKTLRDAQVAWTNLEHEVSALLKGQSTPVKANGTKKTLITALGKTVTQLKGVQPTIKNPAKKAIITDYQKVFEYLVRDLTNSFNLVDDHRSMDFVVSKINSHVEVDVASFKHRV